MYDLVFQTDNYSRKEYDKWMLSLEKRGIDTNKNQVGEELNDRDKD